MTNFNYDNSLSISGNPHPLIINTASAGKEPNSSIDCTTTYSIRVFKGKSVSISAAIDSPLPDHTSLNINLAVPPRAKSIPSKLKTTPQIIATGIQSGTYENLSIIYTFSATVEAGVVPLESKKLILTVSSD